ncbi:MAG: serine/threonine-protein kinase, partial [Polyangia bacterium]
MEAPVGRYELIRLLDQGGMGEVWLARARGPERVHKTVVLKRVRAERANDDAARARFTEEARVAISLSHPHIVPVFEFGELDGSYFLVMEWLRGGDLARVAGVDRAPLSWAAIALIATQLCDALAYVHARANKGGARLVHGDVTPRNVLFSTDGHALLADFGLARFAGRGRAGTPRYQSPEQARGEAFDTRADLYALALVLSEAATGRPAYDRDTERAAKQAKVGVIPDFSGCDEGLATVLRRALAANADGRYADAAAMRAAFEALLDREPGARAAGRAEIIARCGAPAAAEAGDGSRTGTQATREATVAATPSRWGLGALAALLLIGG